MRFFQHKRRQPPAVIIVSLIDILIVLLIFMMVTTTFRQHPALKLVLPQSNQPQEGSSEAKLVVSVAEQPPYFFLGQSPVTLEQLGKELATRAARDPNVALSIRGDTAATWGRIVQAMDAAKAARIRNVSALVKTPAGD